MFNKCIHPDSPPPARKPPSRLIKQLSPIYKAIPVPLSRPILYTCSARHVLTKKHAFFSVFLRKNIFYSVTLSPRRFQQNPEFSHFRLENAKIFAPQLQNNLHSAKTFALPVFVFVRTPACKKSWKRAKSSPKKSRFRAKSPLQKSRFRAKSCLQKSRFRVKMAL